MEIQITKKIEKIFLILTQSSKWSCYFNLVNGQIIDKPYSLSVLYKMGNVPRDQSQSIKLWSLSAFKWEYGTTLPRL